MNIEFFSADGSIISSWLESGNSNSATSTLYWLKLPSGIGASSSITIYMGFAALSVNLFNGRTVGEAPQLSSTYAQYDNGASVFPFYDNFAGSSLNTNLWNKYGSNGVSGNTGGFTVSNGLVLTPASGLFPTANWIGSTTVPAQFSAPTVLDALAAASVNTIYNGRIMFEDTYPSNYAQGNGFGFQSPSDGSPCCWGLATTAGGTNQISYISSSTISSINGQPNTAYQVFTLTATSSTVSAFVNHALIGTT